MNYKYKIGQKAYFKREDCIVEITGYQEAVEHVYLVKGISKILKTDSNDNEWGLREVDLFPATKLEKALL